MLEEDAEEKALAWRRQLDVEDECQIDLLALIPKAIDAGLIANVEIVPNSTLGHAEAASCGRSKTLYLTQHLILAAKAGDARARFTIAHEFGHIAYRHQIRRYRTTNPQHYQNVLEFPRIEERQADAFAAALLAPLHLIPNPRSASVEELVQRFNLSRSAAKRRKENARSMKNRADGTLRPLPPDAAKFLEQQKALGHKVPSLDMASDPQYLAAEARSQGYAEVACPDCGKWQMACTGNCRTCNACGYTTGES